MWRAFGAKGYIALAFWFGSLFAEQVRAEQQSFPFLEIVGEPGAGKTTLIQFLWKLLGRDYEGFAPSKSTSAGRLRTFTQVSNLPIVLIESDRETKSGGQAHVKSFDWDELKDTYNGNSIRTTGVKTGGNETYDPPFRAPIVISQNNQMQASQAIMERICHMTFDAGGLTPASYESAKALEKIEIEQVSGFILAALRREAEVMKIITSSHDENTRACLTDAGREQFTREMLTGTFSSEANPLEELAWQYHQRCEAYDRTVCTGPVGVDGILPATARERSLIMRNAQLLRQEILERNGIGPAAFNAALQAFDRRRA